MATEIIDTKAAARILGVTQRHVEKLCAAGRISGAQLVAGSWIVVAKLDAKKRIRIEVAPLRQLEG